MLKKYFYWIKWLLIDEIKYTKEHKRLKEDWNKEIIYAIIRGQYVVEVKKVKEMVLKDHKMWRGIIRDSYIRSLK